MPSDCFTDLKVLETMALPALRGQLLSARASVLFTGDMARFLWANAAAVKLFGAKDIGELLQNPPETSASLRRQMKAAAGQIHDDQPVIRGFRARIEKKIEFIQFELTTLKIGEGETAVLAKCLDNGAHASLREHDLATITVRALGGVDYEIAIVDEFGLILAASDAFLAVDFEPETISRILHRDSADNEPLITSNLPVADANDMSLRLARISDEPVRFLAVIAAPVARDEPQLSHSRPEQLSLSPGGAAKGESEEIKVDDLGNQTQADDDTQAIKGAVGVQQARNPTFMESDITISESDDKGSEADQPPVSTVLFDDAEETDFGADDEPSAIIDEEDEEFFITQEKEEDRPQNPATKPRSPIRSLLDRWYSRQADIELSSRSEPLEAGNGSDEPEAKADHSQGESEIADDTEDLETTAIADEEDAAESFLAKSQPASPAKRTPASGDANDEAVSSSQEFRFEGGGAGEPVRFAWTIDANGVFQSVSPELAKTVGPNAADIEGRKWRDIANVFGFDHSDEIASLLERRDTWSGKSVLWPVQGTDLSVPVDLAALPVFGSARQFDGFRGFGIIRVADAIVDPEEIGRALSEPAIPSDTEHDLDDKDGDSALRLASRIDDEHANGEADAPFSDLSNVVNLRGPSANHPSTDQSETMPQNSDAKDGRTEREERLSRREASAFDEIARKLSSEAGLKTGEPANPNDDDRKFDDKPSFPPKESTPEAPETEVGKPTAETGSILAAIPAPVLVYRNGDTLYANPELLQVTGYQSTDQIAEAGGVDALFSADIAEAGENPLMTLRRNDGTTIEVNPLLRTVPWQGDKALLLSFRTAAKPSPSEKTAIDMARVSELENILDTATDGIIVTDHDGGIESINASAEALFGIDHDPGTSRSLNDLFAQESQDTVRDYLAEISQPGVAGILNDGREVIGKEANGGLIPLFVTIGKIGEAGKYCIVLRDITQWKKAEEEMVNAARSAETASEQKTEFLARISHEIRTPLNAIIGFSDVMIEERFGPVDNERYREYLRDINRSGVHVLDLINDLLDISKIEAGKMELSYEAVDLNQIVSETAALLQPQANGERIIIRTSLSRAVPRVVADVRSIRQIILNLVSNAIKFTGMNGQVVISTVYEGNGEVVLRVRDTGRGMTEKELEYAMKPFQQIGVTDEKRGHGTGLGLPLTKALVEANRAYFDLESKPGEGTIAHVHFPTQRVLAD